MKPPVLGDWQRIESRVRQAGQILVALDFDGTLAPIAAHPDAAQAPPETIRILQALSDLDRVCVAIVSGRSVLDLRRKLNLDLVYIGNHGLEIEGRGISFLHRRAALLRAAVDHATWDLEAAFQGIPGILIERKGLSTTVHYRQAPGELSSWVETTVRSRIRPHRSGLFVAPALRAWEIRPRVHWNKASAIGRWLRGMRARGPALLICAGDDRADEDTFAAFPDAVSIKVGEGETRAAYCVASPPELADFLRCLEAWLGSPAALASRGA